LTRWLVATADLIVSVSQPSPVEELARLACQP
jgi:hypothetical protein